MKIKILTILVSMSLITVPLIAGCKNKENNNIDSNNSSSSISSISSNNSLPVISSSGSKETDSMASSIPGSKNEESDPVSQISDSDIDVSASESEATEVFSYRNFIGVTHVDGKYNFTDKDFLNEGADKLLELGTRVIKVWLTPDYDKVYPYNHNWDPNNSGSSNELGDVYKTLIEDQFIDSKKAFEIKNGIIHETQRLIKSKNNAETAVTYKLNEDIASFELTGWFEHEVYYKSNYQIFYSADGKDWTQMTIRFGGSKAAAVYGYLGIMSNNTAIPKGVRYIKFTIPILEWVGGEPPYVGVMKDEDAWRTQFDSVKIYGYKATSTNSNSGSIPSNTLSAGKPSTMVELAQTVYYKELFSKPFNTFILEAYEFSQFNWKNGLSPNQVKIVKQEFYDLTKYLLETYKGTGLTFILQNWEGDNAIGRDATPVAIKGMTDWLNARMDGIIAARNEIGKTDVKVLGAAELNKVSSEWVGPKIIDSVLPYTYFDLYSYSNWETGSDAELLKQNLDYIASKVPPSKIYGSKNIMLGEFGAAERLVGGERRQLTHVKIQVETALNWGVQHVVYWELYCNDRRAGVNLETRPVNVDMAGFWLIRPDGSKSLVWDYLFELFHE